MDPKQGQRRLDEIVAFEPVYATLRDQYSITTAEEFVSAITVYKHLDTFASHLGISREQIIHLYGMAYAALPIDLRKEMTTLAPHLFPTGADAPEEN